MTDIGIVYVSVGEECNAEVKNSIISAKILMPNIHITVFTDDVDLLKKSTNADSVLKTEKQNNPFLNKIPPLYKSPYKKTLFVDTDTIFVDSILDTFELLDQFDMLFCHAPMRKFGYDINVPDCFTEINTGVIFYNNTNLVNKFLIEWEISYREAIEKYVNKIGYTDQTPFRECLFKNKTLRYYILPSEYNLRTVYPFFIGGNTSIKILHGTGHSMKLAQDKFINNSFHKFMAVYDFTN